MWIISIHAPRTGSDFSSSRIVLISSNFNPRSPHGERPATPNAIVSMVTFQSTLPARGATQSSTFITHLSAFQSTLPARGATRFSMLADTTFKHFNPRSPHGERQQTVWKHSDIRRNFNPRSPHGERPRQYIAILAECAFQSTLPARGATNQRRAARGREYISIHAPRTGSDWTKAVVDAFVDISIHAPRTGSDYNRSTADAVVDYFNPRSPHGERPPR